MIQCGLGVHTLKRGITDHNCDTSLINELAQRNDELFTCSERYMRCRFFWFASSSRGPHLNTS